MKKLLTICIILMSSNVFAQWVYINEPFRTSSFPADWIKNGTFDTTATTTAHYDGEGEGYLRLAHYASGGTLGYAIYNGEPLTLTHGLKFEFEMQMYSSSQAADGMSFFIFNANQAGGFSPQGAGGSLGLMGAVDSFYVGVGFSAYPTEFSSGQANSVSIRVDNQGENEPSLVTSQSVGALSSTYTTQRMVNSGGLPRKVTIEITPDFFMTVKVRTNNYYTYVPVSNEDISSYFTDNYAPENLRFGFTGTTGGLAVTAELRDLKVSTLSFANLGATNIQANSADLRFYIPSSSATEDFSVSIGVNPSALSAPTVANVFRESVNDSTDLLIVSVQDLETFTNQYFTITNNTTDETLEILSFRTSLIAPEVASSNYTEIENTNKSHQFSLEIGSGVGRIVYLREGEAAVSSAYDFEGGWKYPNVLGSSPLPNGDYFVLTLYENYENQGFSFGNIYGLKPNTTYHAAVYEFNGDFEDEYLVQESDPYRFSFTTATVGFGVSDNSEKTYKINENFTNWAHSVTADFNKDGNPDVLAYIGKKVILYWNTDGGSNYQENILGSSNTEILKPIQLIDANQDGWMDFIFSSSGKVEIYLNNQEGGFTKTVYSSFDAGAVWTVADFNQDGYDDIMMFGFPDIGGERSVEASPIVTEIQAAQSTVNNIEPAYHRILLNNYGNGFFLHNLPDDMLPTIVERGSELRTADFNLDGYVDLFILGGNNDGLYASVHFGGADYDFTQSYTLNEVYRGTADIGDINRDGYPDIIISGPVFESGSKYTRIFWNDGGSEFDEIQHNLPSVRFGNIKLVDINRDGYLDVLITGTSATKYDPEEYITEFYLYETFDETELIFTHHPTDLPNLVNSTLSVNDFNDDGKLDVFVAGYASLDEYYDNELGYYVVNGSVHFANNSLAFSPTSAPAEPTNLLSNVVDNRVTFTWDSGSDVVDDPNQLGYRIVIGTNNMSGDIIPNYSLGSKASSTYRILKSPTYVIDGLNPGTYYWSVATVNNQGQISSYVAEETFEVTNALPITSILSIEGTYLAKGVIQLSWATSHNILVEGYNIYGIDIENEQDTLFTYISGRQTSSYKFLAPETDRNYTFTVRAADENQESDMELDVTFADVFVPANDPYVWSTTVGEYESYESITVGVVWGDYNNDGLLDFFSIGGSQSGLYTNTGVDEFGIPGFERRNISTPNAYKGNAIWTDFDHDGNLDLVMVVQMPNSGGGGEGGGEALVSFSIIDDESIDANVPKTSGIYIFRNNGSDLNYSFSYVWHYQTNVESGTIKAIDVNRDGRSEYIYSGNGGWYESDYMTNLMIINYTYDEESDNPHVFEAYDTELEGFSFSSITVNDFNLDGYPDFAINGYAYENGRDFGIYINNQEYNFTRFELNDYDYGYKGQIDSKDMNGDGMPDILLIGASGGGSRVATIYLNDYSGEMGLQFNQLSYEFLDLLPVARGAALIADINNDGDMDIIMVGVPGDEYYGASSRIYMNSGEGFSNYQMLHSPMVDVSADIADFDNDGILDLILMGNLLDDSDADYGGGEELVTKDGTLKSAKVTTKEGSSNSFTIRVIPLNYGQTNTRPSIPTASQVYVLDDTVEIQWTGATDTETDEESITYNIWITSDFGNDLIPSLSSNSGYRKLNLPGNMYYKTNLTLYDVPDGDYMIYVQAIDGNNQGSEWSNGLPFSVSFTIPVELAAFYPEVSGNSVKLNWKTVSETNNTGFEIQRAIKGTETGKASKGTKTQWEVIGFVNGAGTTTIPQDYSYIDKVSTEGSYQYRLKQVDSDGKYGFSAVLTVVVDKPNVFALDQNYPNPFNPTTTISFSIPSDGMVRLIVIDMLGREVKTVVNEPMTAGYHKEVIDAKELSSGVYFYRLTSSGQTQVKKMLLLK